MSKKIQLKFEPNQEHQLRAIESVVQLLDGMPRQQDGFQLQGDESVTNLPAYSAIPNEFWLENLNEVQRKNGLQESLFLETEDGPILQELGLDSWQYPRFTVEMETGTGKTYAYMRTIYELRKQYGFRKFIIVVPSVAIYEGVTSSFEDMRAHFNALYDNEPLHVTKYDGAQVSKLRSFASSSFTEVMVITVDSFNKPSNNIYKPSEKLPGEKLPIHYVQETRPILILDESQNYLSPLSKQALRTLKPLFAINYSATPKERPNPIYRLGPVQALQQNLVKRIEVLGVTEEFNLNNPQLQLALESISGGYTPEAKVKVLVSSGGKLVKKLVTLKKGDNLFELTKNESHRGLIVEEIDRGKKKIIFTNQEELGVTEKDESHSKSEIFRVQIEETVKKHIQKQLQMRKRGIKVLTLFFIDRVKNYQDEKGIIRKLFEESFEKLKHQDAFLKKLYAKEVHEGYFAQKKSKSGEVEFLDTAIEDDKKTKADKELEKVAYELIMRNKKRLLNFDEKVSFIFAHSALKEGWDNPNVFQICTLNNTQSEMKKRQEIGRGLRLCVNQDGERVMDESVNILTVIANESYEEYCMNLQREYAETGDVNMPPPSHARKWDAERNDKVYKKAEFRAFWEKLMRKTDYSIHIKTDEVVKNAVAKLNVQEYPEPRIAVTKGKFVSTNFKLELIETKLDIAKIKLTVTDTEGNSEDFSKWFRKGDDIAKIKKDDDLRDLRL